MQIKPNQRLSEARKSLGLSLAAFAAPLGRSHQAVHDWEKGNAPILPMTAEAIERHHHISKSWLLDGAGDMFVKFSESDQITVPVLAPKPRAGKGKTLDDYVGGEGGMSFDGRWLRSVFGVAPENLCLMQVDGDSMAPTLAPNEMVFVDGLGGLPEYRDGVWVLRLDGHLFIKRVQLLASGKYHVSCDNPAYRPLEMDDTSRLLGRVVGGPPGRF